MSKLLAARQIFPREQYKAVGESVYDTFYLCEVLNPNDSGYKTNPATIIMFLKRIVRIATKMTGREKYTLWLESECSLWYAGCVPGTWNEIWMSIKISVLMLLCCSYSIFHIILDHTNLMMVTGAKMAYLSVMIDYQNVAAAYDITFFIFQAYWRLSEVGNAVYICMHASFTN